MKEVTRKAVKAFLQHRNGKWGGKQFYTGTQNTEVKDDVLYLHENPIMKWVNGKIYFSMAGWNSRTTIERLSGLGVQIYNRKFIPYINGKEVDVYKWYPLENFVRV